MKFHQCSADRGIPSIARSLSLGLRLPSIQTQHSNTPPNSPPPKPARLYSACQSPRVLYAHIIIDVLPCRVVSRLRYQVRPGGCFQQRVIKAKTSARVLLIARVFIFCSRIFQLVGRCCHCNAGNDEMEHSLLY